jgi:bacterial/archaeal transporter family protein
MPNERWRLPAWALYALLCIISWGLWGFLAKIGSESATALQLQVLFALGMLPVAVCIMAGMRWKLDRDFIGASYGILSGVTTGLGILGYYGALHAQAASIVTPVTGLFPLLTIVLAFIFLRERLNRVQVCGIGLALVAIVILSI